MASSLWMNNSPVNNNVNVKIGSSFWIRFIHNSFPEIGLFWNSRKTNRLIARFVSSAINLAPSVAYFAAAFQTVSAVAIRDKPKSGRESGGIIKDSEESSLMGLFSAVTADIACCGRPPASFQARAASTLRRLKGQVICRGKSLQEKK